MATVQLLAFAIYRTYCSSSDTALVITKYCSCTGGMVHAVCGHCDFGQTVSLGVFFFSFLNLALAVETSLS